MTDFTRREIASLFSGLIVPSLLSSCASAPVSRGVKPSLSLGPLIDAHCHVFNGSDLPVERFIKIAVLDAYPRQVESTLDIDDPDALDGLVALLAWIIGKSNAPSADDEINALEKPLSRTPVATDPAANDQQATANAAEFISKGASGVAGGDASSRSFALIRNALMRTAGAGARGVDNAPLTSEEALYVASKTFHSDSLLGRYMRWAALFTRYRHVLVDDLLAQHRSQGFNPLLLTPALIDYSKWLGQEVTKSPLPRQVEVMARIAERGSVPVHGYVAYDPLRAAYYRRNVDRGFDPQTLVEHALGECGFLGVKLYPPMGFRPIGNESVLQEYPEAVVNALGKGNVGRELDLGLAKLYDACVRLHAPVLAHAAASNAAGPDYKNRADPAHWLPVFARWPKLHVCLAHFGAFDVASGGGRAAAAFPESSWEWAFGRYIAVHPEAPVFMDVSYFSEILDHGAWPKYAGFVQQYLLKFDPECQHLIFGTDWLMLGREKSAETFSDTVYDFFKTQCGLNQDKLDRLFFGNAIKLLGLRNTDATRARLRKFYETRNLPMSRLPSFD